MGVKLLAMILPVVLSALAPGLADAAEEAAGVVRNSAGVVTVNRSGQLIPAAAGMKVHAGDTLNTGRDGSIGIILRDNSCLSLGPESSVVIRTFLFAPAEGKLGLWILISRGSFAYLSGLIGKLAPAAARFETPTASIGIRGTRFALSVDD
jgi:hypothetical protein